MNILVVGNVVKDVFLNLNSHTEHLEADKHGIQWLDVGFNSSEHHFFNRNSSLGGAAISLEVLTKMGLQASVSGTDLSTTDGELSSLSPIEIYRYILIADEKVSYFVPSTRKTTDFTAPSTPVDYLYIDRSAELTPETVTRLLAFLDASPATQLILYLQPTNGRTIKPLIPRATLVFVEGATTSAPADIAPDKLIRISETSIEHSGATVHLDTSRVNIATHLSLYSIATATIVGGVALDRPLEQCFALAQANVAHSTLTASLTLDELELLVRDTPEQSSLELTAASLMLPGKGILAADESGGSIKKKFARLHIPDTYDTRRDYRNIFLATPDLQSYITGVILFDETSTQLADTGQTFTDYLISRRIIPGIKVDQGLASLPHSVETYTQGLDGLDQRLREYYTRGLRFAKWRAAFTIYTSTSDELLTPTDHAITENCRSLAQYASACQSAGLVPIVEPEVVYDGYYTIAQNATVTGKILDTLFAELAKCGVSLGACILKVNMVLDGKRYQLTPPAEVGRTTATVLREHVPAELAGVVFLSGGQTVEQATANLAAIEANGPFPWPVSFSFARALQDPALYAWAGDNKNTDSARQAFLSRLIANTDALKNSP